MLTFGYWSGVHDDVKKEYATAAEAERAARRYAKRNAVRVDLCGWCAGASEENLGLVWPSGQVDLSFEGSYFL